MLLLCCTLYNVVATGNGGCSLITGTKLSKKVEGELDRALFRFNFSPDVDDVARPRQPASTVVSATPRRRPSGPEGFRPEGYAPRTAATMRRACRVRFNIGGENKGGSTQP